MSEDEDIKAMREEIRKLQEKVQEVERLSEKAKLREEIDDLKKRIGGSGSEPKKSEKGNKLLNKIIDIFWRKKSKEQRASMATKLIDVMALFIGFGMLFLTQVVKFAWLQLAFVIAGIFLILYGLPKSKKEEPLKKLRDIG